MKSDWGFNRYLLICRHYQATLLLLIWYLWIDIINFNSIELLPFIHPFQIPLFFNYHSQKSYIFVHFLDNLQTFFYLIVFFINQDQPLLISKCTRSKRLSSRAYIMVSVLVPSLYLSYNFLKGASLTQLYFSGKGIYKPNENTRVFIESFSIIILSHLLIIKYSKLKLIDIIKCLFCYLFQRLYHLYFICCFYYLIIQFINSLKYYLYLINGSLGSVC